MRIGILGGTFDPPHVGHLILASQACHQLALDQVHWLLTPVSPFKQDVAISDPIDRIEMLQSAIVDNPQFILSRIDIERPPPYYAADSVVLFREKFPECELVYLMGADSLRDLPRWHQPERLLSACNSLGVFRRPGVELDLEPLIQMLPGLTQKLTFLNAPLIDISASNIRNLVRSGGAYRYYVLPSVYEIICKRGLYVNATRKYRSAKCMH